MAKKDTNDNKRLGKKVGLIAGIGGGVYALYELFSGSNLSFEDIKVKTSQLNNTIKQQIKTVVKEALKEYDLEKRCLNNTGVK